MCGLSLCIGVVSPRWSSLEKPISDIRARLVLVIDLDESLYWKSEGTHIWGGDYWKSNPSVSLSLTLSVQDFWGVGESFCLNGSDRQASPTLAPLLSWTIWACSSSCFLVGSSWGCFFLGRLEWTAPGLHHSSLALWQHFHLARSLTPLHTSSASRPSISTSSSTSSMCWLNCWSFLYHNIARHVPCGHHLSLRKWSFSPTLGTKMS